MVWREIQTKQSQLNFVRDYNDENQYHFNDATYVYNQSVKHQWLIMLSPFKDEVYCRGICS